MIVRWRRFLHSSSSKTKPSLNSNKNPSSATIHCSQLRLRPEIVDSTLSNCPSDTIALSFFLWAARQPDYFHSPTSFDRIIPAVVRLSLRFGFVSNILRHLESFGCIIKAQSFLILLRIYWRAKKFRFALEVFDELRRRNYEPNTYIRNIVLDAQFKSGNFDEAMRIFRETKFPNFLTFNIVLRNLCESGDWISVRSLLREMVSREFCLNQGTFLMALDCFCKAGRHVELLQLLAFLVVLGRHLSVAMWTVLIDSFCRTGRIEMAWEHLRKMIEAGCSPTVVTYTSFIKGLCEAQMLGEVPAILDGLVKNRKYSKAITLFRKAVSENYCVDVVSYTITIYALCKGGRFDEARALFEQMKHFGPDPNIYTYNVMLCGFCKGRDWVGTKKLLKDMMVTGIEIDCISVNAIARLLIKLGRIDSVLFMLRNIHVHGMSYMKAAYFLLFDGFDHICIGESDAFYSRPMYLEKSFFVENGQTDSHSPQELLVSSGG